LAARAGLQGLFLGFLVAAGCAPAPKTAAPPADPLPSWNAGPTREAITNFVARVTYEGGPDFVPPAERIAVFDNDGTLWSEQPVYFQLAFALDRVKALAPQHPEWRSRQPFKALLAGDLKTALAGGLRPAFEIIGATHTGMTTEEFEGAVREWITNARHPRFQRPYTDLAYQPMLELLTFLRANGFKTYIVSGGGIEFMRPWAERVYGIPPEQVVGSSGKLQFQMKEDKPVLVKLPELDFVDDGPGKPVGIQKFIGRRPIAAFGNSDGDLQMLQWTTAGDGLRLGVIVRHTDSTREWAYDRASHIGKLDKAWDLAGPNGWTVIDMKQDWKRIYAFEAPAN
jgi:phosphoglycolate phosphatase-like HAD superfamily hydrolase